MQGFPKWNDDVGSVVCKQMNDGVDYYAKGDKQFQDCVKQSRQAISESKKINYNHTQTQSSIKNLAVTGEV